MYSEPITLLNLVNFIKLQILFLIAESHPQPSARPACEMPQESPSTLRFAGAVAKPTPSGIQRPKTKGRTATLIYITYFSYIVIILIQLTLNI